MSSAFGTDPDLTRKERREQARTERKALEAAAAAQAARRTRMIRLGAVLGAAIVIVAVILIATSGGGSTKSGLSTTPQARNANVSVVSKLIGGIPQSGNTLGSPKAPVTIQYFGDLECPICKDFTLGALPALIEEYVRPGKLRIEYLSLQTATREPETFRTQQVAAYAAGKQGLAWDYIELFYHEQGQENTGYVTENYLQGLAQQVPGLKLPDWSAARNDPALTEQVTRDGQIATQRGFTGTPSFLIGKTGGTFSKLEYTSLSEPQSFEAAIKKLLP